MARHPVIRSPDQTTAGFSCSVELKRELRKIARDEGRTFSNLICSILADHIDAKKRNKPVASTHDAKQTH